MPVFMLPHFIADLQKHRDAHFARRVMQKTLRSDGNFRDDGADHRYKGIKDAWIRRISRGNTAYRVIYLRKKGDRIYLFRAGEHHIEERLTAPAGDTFGRALPVVDDGAGVATPATSRRQEAQAQGRTAQRFKSNVPSPEIQRAITSRRNLPHKDIWLVSPFVNKDLLSPTAIFGKLLIEQVEDGANVILVTAPPKNQNIEWMEKLEEHNVNVFVYPRLHTKLYCFIFDEKRRYDRSLIGGGRYSSLILLGSSNLTVAGMALDEKRFNEELCYMLPENEIGYIELYVARLIDKGYDLQSVRSYLARGQWQKLEEKWQ